MNGTMPVVGERQDFSGWLQAEMARREWSQSDLSRRSGLHRAVISKLVLGQARPMPDTLRALAKGLNIPPALVFQAAGELPPEVDADPWAEETAYKLSQLDPDLRDVANGIIEGLLRQQEQSKQERTRRSRTKPARP